MELKEIRQEINEIDRQMKELFLKRMEMSGKVAETKRRTGAAVYVKEREADVFAHCSEGVSEDLVPECLAFFGHMMEISRTYQYSLLAEGQECLQKLPAGEGKVEIEIACPSKHTVLPAVCLNAAAIAGLQMEEAALHKHGEEQIFRICLSGDFSKALSRAAILQMLQEFPSVKVCSMGFHFQKNIVQ